MNTDFHRGCPDWDCMVVGFTTSKCTCGFLRVLQFLPPNWPPRYNGNIVECGVNHNNPNPIFIVGMKIKFLKFRYLKAFEQLFCCTFFYLLNNEPGNLHQLKSSKNYEGRIYFGGPQRSDIVIINVHDP
jgi:hypothetical protein